MQYLKNLGIPVLFMLGYLLIGMILRMVIENVLLLTIVTDIIVGIIGLFYCHKFLFAIGERTFALTLVVMIVVVCVSTYDMNEVESNVLQQILLILLVAPFSEEILIRCIWFLHLKRVARISVAYIVSAVIFALLHMNWIMIPFYISFGIILAMIFGYTRRVENCIVVHSLYNLIVLIF